VLTEIELADPRHEGEFERLRPPLAGLDAAVRQRLIQGESVGVVSQGDRYLRIAFCSIDEAAIVPLIRPWTGSANATERPGALPPVVFSPMAGRTDQ
jgi:hypothetical protein